MQRPYRPSAEGEVARQRLFNEAYARAEGGSGTLAAAILAIAILLLVAAYSARQVTEPANAAHLLSVGIAATTDIDLLLDEHYAAMRDEARAGQSDLIQLPGYPLDVNLTPSEVLARDRDALRELILARSAAIVYVQGLEAFDRTGQQAVGILTVQGMLDQAVGQLTGNTNDRAGQAAAVLLIIATVAGAAVLAMNPGFGRFRQFGVAAVLGSAPGVVVTWGLSFLVSRFGGDDAYARDLRAIADAILDTGFRNYLIVLALGAIVAVTGALLGMVADRLPSARPGDSPVAVATGFVPARGLRSTGSQRSQPSAEPEGSGPATASAPAANEAEAGAHPGDDEPPPELGDETPR
ncbi:MAG: hypothetical protein Kow0010_09360 [Dehalococcoidia bacterium]